MAISRNPKVSHQLTDFEPPKRLVAAIADCLGAQPRLERFAVGLSGGPDSAALAICCAELAKQNQLDLHFFHVHHGLHVLADQWMASAAELAQRLGSTLTTQKVTVDLTLGLGVEAAARQARHAALLEMSHTHSVRALMLAHHMQDQAETVLLRLLRGAGVMGLGAMKSVTPKADVLLLRPWLDIDREEILAFVHAYSASTGWQPVDDPSNRDEALGRGALRERVIPALRGCWPAWHRTLSRHAQQAAEAEQLLSEFGQHLLQTVVAQALPEEKGCAIDLLSWRGLNQAQQALVLRTWLAQAGAPMPTQARLGDLMRQLRQLHALGHDRALQWHHGSLVIDCIRGRIELHAKI
jgi:tRNA(Ile)-lysidine synthase